NKIFNRYSVCISRLHLIQATFVSEYRGSGSVSYLAVQMSNSDANRETKGGTLSLWRRDTCVDVQGICPQLPEQRAHMRMENLYGRVLGPDDFGSWCKRSEHSKDKEGLGLTCSKFLAYRYLVCCTGWTSGRTV